MPQPLLDQIKNLSVSELVALTKELQKQFNVSPNAFVPPQLQEPKIEETIVEEPTAFDVYVVADGGRKINVIKTVRELTTLGLKEAKDLIDNLPAPIKTNIDRAEAETIRNRLVSEGATVEMRPTFA